MIYRVILALLIAKAAGFASHPDHHHDDGHMMDDHHDDDHPGHTHDELHTHVELHDCSTAEAFTNVYGCLMQQQMAGCWECPQNNPNGNPPPGTDCESELCNLDCPQCRTWSAVPCSPGFPGPMMSGYTPMAPYSATDPTMVDFCMTEQALTCRRGCHTCGTACVTDTTGGNVPGSVRAQPARRAARAPPTAARLGPPSDCPPRAAAVPGFLRRPDDVLERHAEPQRRLRRRLPRRGLLQRGVPRVRGLHQLPGAEHGHQGLLHRERIQRQYVAAPEPAPPGPLGAPLGLRSPLPTPRLPQS